MLESCPGRVLDPRFPGQFKPVIYILVLQKASLPAPGVIGSVLLLVGSVTVYSNCMRVKA